MKLLIIGTGALAEQAVRLANDAGYDVQTAPHIGGALPMADYVLPVTYDAAQRLESGLFDRKAWDLTDSRLASDDFLKAHGFPIPAYFPGGSEPYIVKPDRGGSGRGIWVTEDFCEVGGAVNAGFVAQEELPGPVWSVAVTGRDGTYAAHPPALLSFDGRRRTGAVCQPAPGGDALGQLAVQIAASLDLRGILEVEAIWHQNAWWVTDLNARLPLFTPDAVLSATGVNLLVELVLSV